MLFVWRRGLFSSGSKLESSKGSSSASTSSCIYQSTRS